MNHDGAQINIARRNAHHVGASFVPSMYKAQVHAPTEKWDFAKQINRFIQPRRAPWERQRRIFQLV